MEGERCSKVGRKSGGEGSRGKRGKEARKGRGKEVGCLEMGEREVSWRVRMSGKTEGRQ